MAMLDIAQPTMQQLGARGTGLLQTALALEQLNRPAPLSKLQSDAQTIDAATNHANMAEWHRLTQSVSRACSTGW